MPAAVSADDFPSKYAPIEFDHPYELMHLKEWRPNLQNRILKGRRRDAFHNPLEMLIESGRTLIDGDLQTFDL